MKNTFDTTDKMNALFQHMDKLVDTLDNNQYLQLTVDGKGQMAIGLYIKHTDRLVRFLYLTSKTCGNVTK